MNRSRIGHEDTRDRPRDFRNFYRYSMREKDSVAWLFAHAAVCDARRMPSIFVGFSSDQLEVYEEEGQGSSTFARRIVWPGAA